MRRYAKLQTQPQPNQSTGGVKFLTLNLTSTHQIENYDWF